MIAGATKIGAQALKHLGKMGAKVPGVTPERLMDVRQGVGGAMGGAAGMMGGAMGGANQLRRDLQAQILRSGRAQMRQPLPSYVPGQGAVMGGLMSGLGSGAVTGNPLVGLGVGMADAGLSQAGARLAQQGLSRLGPYAAAMTPVAQMGVNVAASVGVPIAIESMVQQGQTPQRRMIEQQLASRPHAQMVANAPNSMYQEMGMPY